MSFRLPLEWQGRIHESFCRSDASSCITSKLRVATKTASSVAVIFEPSTSTRTRTAPVILRFHKERAVVRVICHHHFRSLYEEPTVNGQRTGGARVATHHVLTARLAVPQHARAALSPACPAWRRCSRCCHTSPVQLPAPFELAARKMKIDCW